LIVLDVDTEIGPRTTIIVFWHSQKPGCIRCPNRDQQRDPVDMQRRVVASNLQRPQENIGQYFLHIPTILESKPQSSARPEDKVGGLLEGEAEKNKESHGGLEEEGDWFGEKGKK
jgi:hypothetical protein